MSSVEAGTTLLFSEKPTIYIYDEIDRKQVEDSDLFFLLRRNIDASYMDMPWPSAMKNVVVYTRVVGGKGDIAAASKVIGLMQRLNPDLQIDWVLANTSGAKSDAICFLSDMDMSHITVRESLETIDPSLAKTPIDMIFTGPFDGEDEYPTLAKDLKRPFTNPLGVGFREIGQRPSSVVFVNDKKNVENSREGRLSLYSELFASSSFRARDGLVMGLYQGSGVFLDRSLISAPLSGRYSCPSYIRDITDIKLREDILNALGVVSVETLPDMDKHSLNFGYAHFANSWGSFIDSVAVHERDKDVVIVLNQMMRGKLYFSAEDFSDKVFNMDRIDFLHSRRFGNIVVSDQELHYIVASSEDATRSFRVILRKSFLPQDMRCLQLASERILATGDNSSVEAFCGRCKLFFYETLKHKQGFLQQQVDVAHALGHKSLARLWGLFGRDVRMEANIGRSDEDISWGPLQSKEIFDLLHDDSLAEATYDFCQVISEKCDFETRLEAMLKRSMWHHIHPKLKDIELDVIGEEFIGKIQHFFSNEDVTSLEVETPDISTLAHLVRRSLNPFLTANADD